MKYRNRMTLSLAILLPIAATAGPLVDINRADEYEISRDLFGVTLGQGRDIVEYREAHGPFSSVDDLLKVEGISRDFLNRHQDYLHTGEDPRLPEQG